VEGVRATPRRIGLAAVCLMLLPSGTTQAIEGAGDADAPVVASSEPAAHYDYRFLSSPDFLNADIGNTRRSALFRPGDPNSTNKRYEQALDTVLDNFAAEYETGAPRDIFVAGDLVNGHWGIDTDNTGLFGPTKTYRQRLRAVERAGALYYGQWLDRFERHDLTPYAALGDHEIGDDPWGRPGGGGDLQRRRDREFKLRAVPVFKETFSKHILRDSDGKYISRERPSGPAHDTAYAVRPHPEVQLVTLDVFQRTDDDVVAEVDPKQLSWLRNVLRAADRDGVDWTVVQGHTPIAGPVRMRGSSGLMYRAGTRSQLWKVLETEKVDLYLAGEVHDITAHQPRPGGPVQISHGGLFAHGGTNYLVADVTGDTMEITMKSFRHKSPRNIKKNRLWQTNSVRSAPAWVYYDPEPFVSGRMTLTADGMILMRSGNLDVYGGKP
jgi:3',5'-cyclic AMP phosphodiesterase CpdA